MGELCSPPSSVHDLRLHLAPPLARSVDFSMFLSLTPPSGTGILNAATPTFTVPVLILASVGHVTSVSSH